MIEQILKIISAFSLGILVYIFVRVQEKYKISQARMFLLVLLASIVFAIVCVMAWEPILKCNQ